jgi:hypothetical protein
MSLRVALRAGASHDPLGNMEVLHAKQVEETNKSEGIDAGQRYQTAKVHAVLGQRLDIRRFPFDTHRLRLCIEDTQNDTTRQIFEADEIADSNVVSNVGIEILDWKVRGIRTQLENRSYEWASDVNPTFSRYVFEFTIARRSPWRVLWERMFFVVVAVLFAYVSLFLANKEDRSAGRELCMGSLLLLIPPFVSLHQELPLGLAYADCFMLASALFILSCLLTLSPFDRADICPERQMGEGCWRGLNRSIRWIPWGPIFVNSKIGPGTRLLLHLVGVGVLLFKWSR